MQRAAKGTRKRTAAVSHASRLERRLVAAVREAVATEIRAALGRSRAVPDAAFSEMGMIARESGIDFGAPVRALAEGADAYRELVAGSLTVEQAARLLGVNGSRIRQRLSKRARTLYGIRLGRAWRLPRFQFERDGVVPGIAGVLPSLPRDLHPVAVAAWFATPNDELADEKNARASPLEWLRNGHHPSAVAKLARAL